METRTCQLTVCGRLYDFGGFFEESLYDTRAYCSARCAFDDAEMRRDARLGERTLTGGMRYKKGRRFS